MNSENMSGTFYIEDVYTLKEIGPGVVSKGQALRYFQKQHPEYRVIGINNFKVNQDNFTVKIKVLVTKKINPLNGYCQPETENCPRKDQKLLNPGYDELTEKLKCAEAQIEEFKKGAEGRPCLCGKCADHLRPGYDELIGSHAKLAAKNRGLRLCVNALKKQNATLAEYAGIDISPEALDVQIGIKGTGLKEDSE